MTLDAALGYLAAGASLLLAAVVLWRERRLLAYRAFAAGMIVLAAREFLGVLALGAIGSEAIFWHRARLVASSALPGLWLLFALTFARAEEVRFLRRWRWALAAAFVVPIGLATLGWYTLVIQPLYETPRWVVVVGSTGFWLHAALLLGAVAVLMNLEGTLRASSGAVRWQVKLTVLGLGALFGVEIFLASQVLLFSVIQTTLLPLGSAALLLAVGFVSYSMARRRLGRFDVYPSESFLFNSLTLLVVGVYLLAVSFLAEVLRRAFDQQAPLVAFVVVLALVVLVLVLLSTELRERAKRFVARHLKRPSYDYRALWNNFTRRTSSIVEVEPLAAAITKFTAETFGCPNATIWLVPEGERRLTLGGSTAVSVERARELLEGSEQGRPWIELMERELESPLHLLDPRLPEAARDLARDIEARYTIALLSSQSKPIGFLAVNERVAGKFSLEDFGLLKTLADQTAAAIQNRQLTKRVQQAKEMETFQTLSTFFIHDLKNLASRLSLVLQNLPVHYDKPAFRDDLLETMEKSLAKIDTMTARLSSLTEGLTLHRSEIDLNALVRESLAGLNGSTSKNLESDLREIPRLSLDPEQIQKVVTNLLLNAQEATGEGGYIRVTTSRDEGWVLLSVTDDGCGMSPDFVAKSLFKPFQTTKKQGLGIGLFHTKTIVEAHGGRIEVDSVHGRGSTFRVVLPIASETR